MRKTIGISLAFCCFLLSSMSSVLMASEEASSGSIIHTVSGKLRVRTVIQEHDRRHFFSVTTPGKSTYALKVPSHIKGVALILRNKYVEIKGVVLKQPAPENSKPGIIKVKNIRQSIPWGRNRTQPTGAKLLSTCMPLLHKAKTLPTFSLLSTIELRPPFSRTQGFDKSIKVSSYQER